MIYVIKEQLAELSSSYTIAKRLTLTSWSGNPAKLDIRMWRTEGDTPQPGKGMTLTDSEAKILADAIYEYLEGTKPPEDEDEF